MANAQTVILSNGVVEDVALDDVHPHGLEIINHSAFGGTHVPVYVRFDGEDPVAAADDNFVVMDRLVVSAPRLGASESSTVKLIAGAAVTVTVQAAPRAVLATIESESQP